MPLRPAPTRELHIDFETRSLVDLKRCGVFRYAEDPSTSVLCMGYAFEENDPDIWIPRESPFPPDVRFHIEQGGLIYAHNAQFERTIMRYCLKDHLDQPTLKQWRCTAAMAAALSLPRDLDRAAKAVGLDVQKDERGRRIMLKLCAPRQAFADGTIVWWEGPADLQALYDYCKQDVIVERELTKKLRPLSEREQKVWRLDQAINERGVAVDRAGVQNAKIITQAATAELNIEISTLTDGYVSAISQAQAIKEWCAGKGVALESIDKIALADALKNQALNPAVRRVLELRQEGAKSSTAKLKAYQDRVSKDGRMRDNLMYYGANTGRWSGRGAQLQNLPRSKIQDIPEAIDMMKFRDPKRLAMFYGPPLETVSDCLRGFVVAPPGKKLVAADFSNIEGRVLAWLSGFQAKIDAFANGVKIYERLAARIFDIPVETVKKGSKERHLGKEGELGGGYGMGWERFMWQCAKNGLTIEEDLARRTIDTYRAENEPIVHYWSALNSAATRACQFPGNRVYVEGTAGTPREVSFAVSGNILWCLLPSGRFLTYPDPRLQMVETPWSVKAREEARALGAPEPEPDMRLSVTYMTVDSITNQWMRDKTYGGKLAENVTSGTARDIMVDAMFALEAVGYEIVLTVHDEIVSEVDESFGSVREVEEIMSTVPKWAAGCPIAAEGFEAKRYKK